VESLNVDGLDRQIIHSLSIDGRASFSKIAEVLGVSDQTVARRYRKLRAEARLRVVGLPDPVRIESVRWWIRLQCLPGAAQGIAESLARRPDTAWVQLVSGGSEILCSTRVFGSIDQNALLLDKLPRTGRIISITSHAMIHLFAGGPLSCWPYEWLDPDQVARLRPPAPARAHEEPPALSDLDRRLLEALSRDGRTPHAELAKLLGWSESSVRRRMEQLQDLGILYFDIEIDFAAFGYHTHAWLWMSVPPSEIHAVGNLLADHREVVFAAATTGPSNLCAAVLCRNPAALYDLISQRLGSEKVIQSMETMPVIRTLKQSAAVLPVS
jgi:DNA-binding Lrp family transcriptional regulator